MKKSKILIAIMVMMLVIGSFVLIGCKDDPVVKTPLATPENLRIEEGYLVWNAVENATGYNVIINEEAFATDTNKIILSFKNVINTYTVTAVGAGSFTNSAASVEVKTQQCVTPKNFQLKGNSLTWDAIEGAGGYSVWFDGNKKQKFDVATNSINLVETEQNDYSNIRVQAKGSGFFFDSPYSTKYNDIKALADMKLALDTTTNILSWQMLDNDIDKADDVEKYLISVNEGEIKEQTTTSLTLVDLLDTPNIYTIEITAVSKNPNKISVKKSLRVKSVFSPTISVKNGLLNISSENKDKNLGLELIIERTTNGKSATTVVHIGAAVNYDLKEVNSGVMKIEARFSNSSNIQNVALEDKNLISLLGSKKSAPLENVTKLETPTPLFANSQLTWQKPNLAGINCKYEYKLISHANPEGTVYKFLGTSLNLSNIRYANKPLTSGEYEIQIKVLSVENAENYLNSNFTDRIKFKILDMPTIKIEDKIASWQPIDGAGSYKLEIDSLSNENDIASFNIGNETQYNFGAKHNLASDYYTVKFKSYPNDSYQGNIVESAYASANFTVLPTPTLKIENGVIFWEHNLNATKYNVKIDGAIINKQMDYQNGFDLKGYKAGAHNIEVQAIGDNKLYFDSNFSANKEVTKLAIPTNIQVTEDENRSINNITWDAIKNGADYIKQYELEIRNTIVKVSLGNGSTVNTGTNDIKKIIGEFTKQEIKVKAATYGSASLIYSDWTTIPVSADEANGDFYAGTGTKSNPYIIMDYTDLNNIRKYNDKGSETYFKIVNNIDAYGELWQPIDNFITHIDGANYTISNLTINITSRANVGFIANAKNNATLENIKIKNANILVNNVIVNNSGINVGILVGLNDGATINNCSVSGKIEARVSNNSTFINNIGGLIGKNDATFATNKVFSNCDANVNIIVNSALNNDASFNVNVGGVAGYVVGYMMSNIKATGEIKMLAANEAYVGGLIGVYDADKKTMQNCWSSTNITGVGKFKNIQFAGLVSVTKNKGTIEKCYSIGNITLDKAFANDISVAGFIVDNSCIITRCYAENATINVKLNNNYNSGVNIVLSGFVSSNIGSIKDCYANNKIMLSEEKTTEIFSPKIEVKLVGFVGISNNSENTIERCYVDGNISHAPITNATISIAGFAINIAELQAVKNCYFNLDNLKDIVSIAEGDKRADNVIGLNSMESKQQMKYTNWDFVTVWNMEEKPILR
ncbi:MAG: hypothetical protein RR374_03235 [Clostridia bacterium]